MAYVPSAFSPHDVALAQDRARRGPSFWRMLIAALMEARQRQADREIARYLAASGGKITDEAEREIERRFLSAPRW